MKTARRWLTLIPCFAMLGDITMKTDCMWLKLSLISAMLFPLVSCAAGGGSYVPAPGLTQRMSATQARKVLIEKLKQSQVCYGERCAYKSLPWDSITSVRVSPTQLVIADASGRVSTIKLNSIVFIGPSGSVSELGGKNTNLIGGDPDAMYVLQQNAINALKEADKNLVSFLASLPDFRKKAAENAALPEEANKYKVQAEGAVRDKEFDDAADLYAEALKIAPWWPAGHFNRALVLSETGDFGMAIRNMKHYLQLVPDAPNARAAQNKIYEWERLESK